MSDLLSEFAPWAILLGAVVWFAESRGLWWNPESDD